MNTDWKNAFLTTIALGAALICLSLMPRLTDVHFSAKPQGVIAQSLLSTKTDPFEISYGSDKAPITIVEYFSFTCSHCAHFHKETLPYLEQKYIGPGLVHLILRPFPLDPLSAAATMLAECEPGLEKHMTSLLLEKQDSWINHDKPVTAFETLAAGNQINSKTVKSCLHNQALLDRIIASRDDNKITLDLKATPTIFINGTRYVGALNKRQIDEILAPLL